MTNMTPEFIAAGQKARYEVLRQNIEGYVIPDSFASLGDVVRSLEFLMKRCGDPLMPCFFKQAILEFAREVLKADPAEITKATNGCVTGEAWQRCARAVLEERDETPF